MSSRNTRLRARILASSSATAIGLSLAATAGGVATAQEAEVENRDRVTVTGSRIQRQDFTANSPIVTVEEELFENTTSLTVESVLNQLPQFTQDARSEFRTTSVEPTTDQSPGTAQVNLRGLGSNRSLVLIDGRRAMPVNGAMAVDVNSIPSSAIERVEIISGGASAVYGADAVGGVVNFILKDDFEGLDLTTRYGITERGDQETVQISGLWGANVSNGRGNVMFGGDFSSRGNALFVDRDWLVEQANDPYTFSEGVFALTVPRENYYNPDQFGRSNLPSAAAIDSIFENATGTISGSSNFYINPNSANPDFTNRDVGSLFTTGTFGASGGYGGYKYNGPLDDPNYPGCPYRVRKYDSTVLEYICFAEIATPLDRYSFFGRGTYDITDKISLFGRANYVSTYTRSQLLQGSANVIIPYGEDIWLGNDYSPSSLLANGNTHPDYLPGGRFGLNCPTTGGCTESQAFPAPLELQTLLNSRPDPEDSYAVNVSTDFGPPRGSATRNDIFQVEMGLEGELSFGSRDIFWDFSISHGETHSLYTFTGFGSLGRFRAVAESPNFGRGFEYLGNPDFANSQAGSGTCTTGLPIMRTFDPSQDCIDAYEAELQNSIFLEQNTVELNATGDLFNLPAGTLQYAIGASFRENSLDFKTDTINDLENFFDQPVGLFPKSNSKGYISVGELYGELLVPVIKNVPFIQQLDLELGGRVSDYNPSGTVGTYKVLADWTINDWARLRGGYNRATRAPNLNELFAARATTVATGGFSTDMCALNDEGTDYSANPDQNVDGAAGAAHTVEVCRAIMMRDSVAAGLSPDIGANTFYGRPAEEMDPGSAGSAVLKGNPDVGPETADTWTAGLVLSSPFQDNAFLSGFTGSIDYYRIEINDLISTLSTPALQQDCFSQANNPNADPNIFACSRFVRNALNGEGLFIDRTYTNLGYARLSGVDLQVTWRGEFADLGLSSIPGGLGVNVVATFPIEQLTQGTPTSNIVDGVGTQYSDLGVGGGAFDFTTLTTISYTLDELSLSLRWQYSPAIEPSAFATNPATTNVGPGAASLFGISGSYRVSDIVTFRAGVDNLFDTKPPYQGTPGLRRPEEALIRSIGGFGGSGAGAGAYDILGRRYFFGIDVTY